MVVNLRPLSPNCVEQYSVHLKLRSLSYNTYVQLKVCCLKLQESNVINVCMTLLRLSMCPSNSPALALTFSKAALAVLVLELEVMEVLPMEVIVACLAMLKP